VAHRADVDRADHDPFLPVPATLRQPCARRSPLSDFIWPRRPSPGSTRPAHLRPTRPHSPKSFDAWGTGRVVRAAKWSNETVRFAPVLLRIEAA
jgi:hypothetical protein